jgi:hypothetical protein
MINLGGPLDAILQLGHLCDIIPNHISRASATPKCVFDGRCECKEAPAARCTWGPGGSRISL